MIDAVLPSYARADIAFERGEGAYIFSTDGRRFLDFGAGVAVNSCGHGHPHLVEALVKQGGALWHCSNLYRVPGQERLARRLVENSFADTVFFCNSGAEAVEAGLKMIRKHHDDTGHPERFRVICFEGSFHGRTLTTISAGASEAHRKGFEPVVNAFDHVPLGNLNEVRDKIGPETAGILIEPVQGEGGIRPVDAEFLRALRKTCDEFGLLLMYDEVQCGIGRTGKLFGYEWSGAAPDVMALAKGLGGGFPIGACLATEAAAKGMTYGTHGSTFGGNPLAMAVANAVLDVVLAPGFLENVRNSGALLEKGLRAAAANHPKIIELVRGVGLMWGIKTKIPNGDLSKKLIANGMLNVLAGDNVVRFLPPLIVGKTEIDEAIEILEKSCRELEG